MKRTKRERHAIIIHILFYTSLLILLIYFSISYFYPKIIAIEQQKKDTRSLYESTKNVEKSWLTFEEFQTLSTNVEKSVYVTEVLKNIEKDFYSQNLYNSEFSKFSDFLDAKKTQLSTPEIKNILDKRERKIIKILPSYSETYTWNESNALTDFKFVNYIEAIIETFRLSYTDAIGIKNLVLIDDFESGNVSDKSLETNLFYIPVKLTLTGNKTWIINFLHFVENVWKISVLEEENNIEIYKDNFLSHNGRDITLEGSRYASDYNIYENQVIDISDIKIEKYPDSSILRREQEDLVDFIKRTQWNEKMEITVKLNFYVKWFPHYKLENFVKEVLSQYDSLSKWVNQKLKENTKDIVKQAELQKINSYLKEISKDIWNMRKNLRQKQNIDELYKRAVAYYNIFTVQEKEINY